MSSSSQSVVMHSLLKKVDPYASFVIDDCTESAQNQSSRKNYINKLQVCCLRKKLAIGTENGRVYLFDCIKKEIVNCVMAEPWLSSIENCRGNIWTSGMSRSLMCIRVKDNKKTFHTNLNTSFRNYDSNPSLNPR